MLRVGLFDEVQLLVSVNSESFFMYKTQIFFLITFPVRTGGAGSTLFLRRGGPRIRSIHADGGGPLRIR